MLEVTSWGRLRSVPHEIVRPAFLDNARAAIRQSDASLLCYGIGRSYGDVCLNENGRLVITDLLDRIISFDREKGIVRAEAGLSLDRLLRVVVPRGWFAPVVPGTKFVTLGGAVANDVHGKNHEQVGTFGAHVRVACSCARFGSLLGVGAEFVGRAERRPICSNDRRTRLDGNHPLGRAA